MPTPRETILAALHARLSALPATALRGEVLPERVPAEGLLILRDGEPGEPEVTLLPLARLVREGTCCTSAPNKAFALPRGRTTAD